MHLATGFREGVEADAGSPTEPDPAGEKSADRWTVAFVARPAPVGVLVKQEKGEQQRPRGAQREEHESPLARLT